MAQFSETSVADGLVCRCVNAVTESEFSHTLCEIKKRMEQQTKIFLGEEHPSSPEDVSTSFEKVSSTTLPDVKIVPSIHTLFNRASARKAANTPPSGELQSNGTAEPEEPPPPFERSKTIVVIPAVTREKTFICENAEVRASINPPTNLPSKRAINTTGSPAEVQTRKSPAQSTRGPRAPRQRARWVRPPTTAGGEVPRRTPVATVAPLVQQKSIPKHRISTPMSRHAANKGSATPNEFVSRPVTPSPAVTSALNSPRTPRQVSLRRAH